MGGNTVEFLCCIGVGGMFRVSLFTRSSRFRLSVLSRAFTTRCLGKPWRIKWVVSISAFKRKSSGLVQKRLILTNCE